MNHGIFSSNAILLMKLWAIILLPQAWCAVHGGSGDASCPGTLCCMLVWPSYSFGGDSARSLRALRGFVTWRMWGNGLGLRDWYFRNEDLSDLHTEYLDIYIYTRMPEASTNCHVNLCLVWPNSGTSIPKGDLSIDTRHQPPMEKHLKDLVQNNLKRNTKSLNPFTDPPIWGFSSCCCMVAFESTCNTASAGGWEGMGWEASTRNHVNSVLKGVIKGAYPTRLSRLVQ